MPAMPIRAGHVPGSAEVVALGASEVPAPALEQAESAVVDRIEKHLALSGDPRTPDALPAALRLRNDPGCAATLAELRDERAIPLLVRCLAGDYARAAEAESPWRFGTAVMPALIRAVETVSPEASPDSACEIGRAAAVEVLGRIGGRFARQPLLRALHDRNRHVRLSAARRMRERKS